MIQKLNQKAVDDNGEPVHLLAELGKLKDVPFEISIGANGFIWIKSKSMVINLLIAQAIQSAVDLPVSEYRKIGELYRQSIDHLR
jgi:exosome complex RNA-binding protein Rrp4